MDGEAKTYRQKGGSDPAALHRYAFRVLTLKQKQAGPVDCMLA
jgi:hypothetical protein